MNENIVVLVSFFSAALSFQIVLLNRYAAIVLEVLVSFTAFMLLFFLNVPVAAAALVPVWILGALICSLVLFSEGSNKNASDKIVESREKAKLLEKDLLSARKEFASLVKSEKESILMYSVIKVLSEATEAESVKAQFMKYISDILEAEKFAFCLVGRGMEMTLVCRTEDFKILPGELAAKFPKIFGEKREKFSFLPEEKILLFPVYHFEDLCGLFVSRCEDNLAASDLAARAENFFSQISFAVRRLQLFSQVDSLSRVDGLTGTYRRNVLDEKIEEEIKRANSFKTTFAFMIADIDHFKEVNDRYGHQFGDFVLRRVGEILKNSVYETDFVGRYGGEEFGIILPRADCEGVLRKAEAIRSKIENEVFTIGFESVKITLSIGIAHFPRDAADAAQIIKMADDALYYAKEHGRNRVVDITMVRRSDAKY